MQPNDLQKNRNLKLIRGGQYGRRVRVRTAKEIELDERMRRMYVRCVGENGTVPSRAVQLIREGRQTPWRVPARRAIEMARAGVPADDIRAALVDEFANWLNELLADFDPKTPVNRALRRAS